jgi:DNA-binding NarL/FixJ family response regulator
MTSRPEAPLRILVCDDDVVLSRALAMLIESITGMELVATPVTTGRGAVAGAAAHHPDVVLMDVNLEGEMDGFAATVLIKQEWPATNVIIMSGMPDPARASTQAHRAGAFDFVPKSRVSQDIVDAVRAAGRATRTATRLAAAEPPAFA